MPTPIILAVISLCLCVVFFFYFRRYIDRKTSVERLLADYRTEVYRLIAEIDAVTDRNLRLVEDSVKTLKQLLDDTDKRIGVYTRELERSRKAEAMYTNLGRGIRVALDSERPPVQETASSKKPPETPSVQETPASKETSSPQKTTSEKETPPPPKTASTPHRGSTEPRFPSAKERRTKKNNVKPPRETEPSLSSKRRLKVRIAEMSARGLTPHEIASRLNLSLTEVDLALNLLQRPNN
jgi:hypothetical protein